MINQVEIDFRSEGDNGTIHSKIYYYHTLAEAKEKIIVELYLLPDFPPVSGEGGSRIEVSAVTTVLPYAFCDVKTVNFTPDFSTGSFLRVVFLLVCRLLKCAFCRRQIC